MEKKEMFLLSLKISLSELSCRVAPCYKQKSGELVHLLFVAKKQKPHHTRGENKLKLHLTLNLKADC